MTTVLEMQVPGSGAKPYDVKRYDDGSWWCTCPSFRFQKNKPANQRICKHVASIIALAASDPEVSIDV